MSPEEVTEETTEEQVPFILINLDMEAAGDPMIRSNLSPSDIVMILELAKQKAFAQYFGAVQQIRAQAALKKPDLTIARAVPPDLRR